MYSIIKTYKNFKGEEREKEFLFNLTAAEIAEIDINTPDGFVENIKRILKEDDMPALNTVMKDLISKAYGVCSEDGEYFEKSPELRAKFESTQAYSDIYVDFLQNTEKFTDFINGIIPNVADIPGLEEKAPKKSTKKTTTK